MVQCACLYSGTRQGWHCLLVLGNVVQKKTPETDSCHEQMQRRGQAALVRLQPSLHGIRGTGDPVNGHWPIAQLAPAPLGPNRGP
jgi:hypothetical protein